MTDDLTAVPAAILDRNASDQPEHALKELVSLAVVIGSIFLHIHGGIRTAAERAERDHHRGRLLTAYRARHKWRAGDVHALESLDANEVAHRRVSRLTGGGRPVVRRHRPLWETVGERLATVSHLFAKEATAAQRRQAFFHWPWWKHHVEALYRGELDAARAAGTKGAHDAAERAVADAIRVSPGRVHAVCSEVRALRREDALAADFPSMALAEYEDWMERGGWPARLEA